MWQRESKANSVNLQANIPDSGEGCQAKSTIQLFSCRLVSSIENGQLFSIRLSQNLDKVGEKQKKKKKKICRSNYYALRREYWEDEIESGSFCNKSIT